MLRIGWVCFSDRLQKRVDWITLECDPEYGHSCKYNNPQCFALVGFVFSFRLQKQVFDAKHKKTNPQLSLRVIVFDVIAPGFEPGTVCLEGRCSIQLSYATRCAVVAGANIIAFYQKTSKSLKYSDE